MLTFLRQFVVLMGFLFVFPHCSNTISQPSGKRGAQVNVDGWSYEGNNYEMTINEQPTSEIPLVLDFGSVGASAEAAIVAKIRNIGSTTISMGAVLQDSGNIRICACEGGSLNFGALPPGGCLRIKAEPTVTNSGVQGAHLFIDGLVDLKVSAQLPSGTTANDGGLTIASSCD